MNDEPGEGVSGTLGTGVTYARRGAALGQPGRSAHLCQKGAAGSDTRVSPGWRPCRQNLSARSESSPVVSGCLRLLHTMHMHVMLTWFLRHSCGQDIITSWGFVDIPVTLNSLKTICLLHQKMPLLWPFYPDDHAPAFTRPFSVLVLEIAKPDVSCPLGPLGGQGCPGAPAV